MITQTISFSKFDAVLSPSCRQHHCFFSSSVTTHLSRPADNECVFPTAGAPHVCLLDVQLGLKRFFCLPKCITDEERGEERTRHSDDRLMAVRLERDQEKVLR